VKEIGFTEEGRFVKGGLRGFLEPLGVTRSEFAAGLLLTVSQK
jgi:hypothetical protein